MKEGKRLLMLYRLGGGGAEQLAWWNVREEERPVVGGHLGGRGVAIAEYDFYCGFVWVRSATGITVYDRKGKVLDAVDGATLEDGRAIARTDIVRVAAFANGYVFRGVKAVLRSGKEVLLVTEASGVAMGDPTYSRNELICETVWTSTIARAIAAWAGAEYQDLI